MDERRYLNLGSVIDFPGMSVTIEAFVGMGSNACVYKGSYEDGLNAGMRHTVLVKELFPYDAKGGIFRNESGAIVVLPEAEEIYALHQKSFERGNEAHLRLLSARPDLIGGNINTARVNGTLYTILAESGGTDFRRAEKPATVKIAARRILSILDALSAFHDMSLCHLDISPDNILLVGMGENERAMLIDYNSVFSLRELQFGEGEYFSVKPGYTSPEVVNKNLPQVSFASDLYSVAAVFYTLVSGAPMTLSQMLGKNPPDVSGCEIMKNAPETVKMQVRSILKKGLSALPSRRYKSISEMREAFEELMMRIDMLGVTHSSLWEAGRRAVQTLTKNNPFYAFLTEDDRMFPIRIAKENGESADMDEFLLELTGEEGKSALLVSQGGMGKTTLLLKCALNLSKEYAPNRPAQLYVSLAGRAAQKKDLILDVILENLRFSKDTLTYDGARHQLKALLSAPMKTKAGDVPALVLLLDGLNEVKGDCSYLVEEIANLSALAGVRILISSRSDMEALPFEKRMISPLEERDIENALSLRGLLMPESEEIRHLLKTPLMLSVFIEASGEEKQLSVEKETELMDAYVSALLDKEKEALGEEESEKYRVEAAVRFVLPALSEAILKNGALSEAEMYRISEKCRKMLSSAMLLRAFPGWLGHRKEIVLGSADEFFGKTVREILWRRMGLIVIDGESARVSHQKIAEYLTQIHLSNIKRVKKRLMIKNALLTFSCAVVLAGLVFLVVKAAAPAPPAETVRRPAYDDAMVENTLSGLSTAYVQYAQRDDEVYALVESAAEGDGSVYEMYAPAVRKAVTKAAEGSRVLSAYTIYIGALMEPNAGEVVSWSQKEFDGETGLQLIGFSQERAKEYESILEALSYWMEYENLNQHENYKNFPELIMKLLDADAKTAAQMYQYVYAPHAEGISAVWKDLNAKNIAMHPAVDGKRVVSEGYEAYQQYQSAREAGRNALSLVQTKANQILEYVSIREGGV